MIWDSARLLALPDKIAGRASGTLLLHPCGLGRSGEGQQLVRPGELSLSLVSSMSFRALCC